MLSKNDNSSFELTDWDEVIAPYLYSELDIFIMTVILPIIVIIGIVGNVFTIVVLSVRKNMRNSLNIYLINLAISDCLFLLISPIVIWFSIATSPLSMTYDRSFFSDVHCQVYMFAIESTYQLSALFIIAISIERFLAIAKPMKYRIYVSKKRTIKISCAIWLLTLIYRSRNIPVTGTVTLDLPWPDMTNGLPNSTTVCAYWNCEELRIGRNLCTMVHVFQLFDVILVLICSILLIVTYIMLLLSVRRTSIKNTTGTTSVSNRVDYEMKAWKTVVITVSVYIMFTGPLNGLLIYYHFSLETQDEHVFLNAFKFLTFVNSAINPIIYNVTNESYRRELFSLLRISKAEKQKKLDTRSTDTGSSSNGEITVNTVC